MHNQEHAQKFKDDRMRRVMSASNPQMGELGPRSGGYEQADGPGMLDRAQFISPSTANLNASSFTPA